MSAGSYPTRTFINSNEREGGQGGGGGRRDGKRRGEGERQGGGGGEGERGGDGGRGRGLESSSGRGKILSRRHGSINPEKPDPTTQWETQGNLLDMLHIEDICPSAKHLTVNDVQYIASYNWLDQKTPTILVPGRF